MSSLGRVLTHSESGLTLDGALTLGTLPEGSALIAGSTMVQTCLGELWLSELLSPWFDGSKPNVDVFCSAKASSQVPTVRSSSLQNDNTYLCLNHLDLFVHIVVG